MNDKSGLDKTVTINVLSQNLHFTQTENYPIELYIDTFLKYLGSMKYDILLFQGFYTSNLYGFGYIGKDWRTKFVKGCNNLGYNHIAYSGAPGLLMQDKGLMIISKYPLSKYQDQNFKDITKTWFGPFYELGFIQVSINLSPRHKVTVINAKLEYEPICSIHQADQLNEHLRTFSHSDNVILAGDFGFFTAYQPINLINVFYNAYGQEKSEDAKVLTFRPLIQDWSSPNKAFQNWSAPDKLFSNLESIKPSIVTVYTKGNHCSISPHLGISSSFELKS